MEQQYGERYIMKLEERLLHYLEELNKALPQPTYIDQVRPCACLGACVTSIKFPFVISYIDTVQIFI